MGATAPRPLRLLRRHTQTHLLSQPLSISSLLAKLQVLSVCLPHHTPQATFASATSSTSAVDAKGPLSDLSNQANCMYPVLLCPALVPAKCEGTAYLEPGIRLGSYISLPPPVEHHVWPWRDRGASAGKPSLPALSRKPQGDSHTCTLHNPGAQL